MNATAALRVTEYRLVGYRRVWKTSVLVGFANPVLFLLAMGIGVGSLIDANDPIALDGREYLAFLAPGLLAATAMNIASVEATYPILMSVKWVPVAYGQVATPVQPADIGLGQLLYITLRMLLSSVVFVGVMVVFGAVESWWAVAAAPAATLTGLAFAAPLVAWSITQENDFRFPPLQRFVILPMYLFSGTFFPVEELPAVVRPIAWVTPLWHGVRLCRDLSLGEATAGAAAGHATVLVAIAGVGAAMTVRNYRRRLET